MNQITIEGTITGTPKFFRGRNVPSKMEFRVKSGARTYTVVTYAPRSDLYEGVRVRVVGDLKQETWRNREGQERSKTVVAMLSAAALGFNTDAVVKPASNTRYYHREFGAF